MENNKRIIDFAKVKYHKSTANIKYSLKKLALSKLPRF